MSISWLSHQLKVGSVLTSTFLAFGLPQLRNETTKITSLNLQISGHVIANVEETSDSGYDMTIDEIIQNLNEAGLLTDETYSTTLREREQGIIRLRSQLLSKLLEQNSSYAYVTFVSIEIEDTPAGQYIPESQNNEPLSVEPLNLEPLNNDLEQLNNTGVLTIATYEYLKSAVETGRLFHTIQLYRLAQTQLAREESVDPDLLKPRLDALKSANILSEQRYRSLLAALEASALQNPIEFLTYIERAQMFDMTDYSVDPALYFPAIYRSVAQMLSSTGIVNGEISEFGLELILDETYGIDLGLLLDQTRRLDQGDDQDTTDEAIEALRFYDAVVSVEIDNRNYEQVSFYSPPGSEQEFLGRIESEGIVNLFNKVLQDQSSPYRLFPVSSFAPHIDYSRFGVIALTKAQSDVYLGGRSNEADYASTFTSDYIAEVVTLLSDTKLLEHLSTDEISEGERQIARQYITHPHQILSAFEDVVMLFDWESAGGETPYKYLLEALAKISHGGFEPTDIEDNFNWESQTAGLAFTVNRTRYSTELNFESDWLDPQFFEFVNSVVDEEVSIGAFYPLSEYGYSTDGYIFLDDEQLEVLRSQQLIIPLTE